MTPDIVAIGEALIEFNQTGEGSGRHYLQGFGGDTSNAMIAAARHGVRAGYITAVGDDEFGGMLRSLWQAEGIDTRGVRIDRDAPTGLYFVTHGPDGHRFTYRRAGSAASRMQAGDLPRPLIEGARWLHASGISQAISDSARATVREAIRIARAAGVRVAFDPNLRLRLWSLQAAREALLEVLAEVDLFLPSRDDVMQLSGCSEPADIVQWCHRHGAAQVVLKLGAEGALVSDGSRLTPVPAFRVDAVDATGAGDCFDGTLLARLALGSDLVEATRVACAAAALSTLGYGAVEPVPDRATLEAFLQQRMATR